MEARGMNYAAEDTPSGASPEDVETVPVLDRADLAPKIQVPIMVKKKHGVIIETPMEARQAEPGPSVLLLLVVSVGRCDRSRRYLVRVLPSLGSDGPGARRAHWRD
jgi:hypothetical protein